MINSTVSSEKKQSASVEDRPPAGDEDGRTGRAGLSVPPLSTAHIRPRMTFYEGASLLKVSKRSGFPAVGGGLRKEVKGFSRASRLRLLRTIGAIRRDAELPDFVTLTYPSTFPPVERSKRDIKVFFQRLGRRFPQSGCIWKLEPQQRGAPHFHLLVWGCETSELHLWVSRAWYDVAGEGDENHLRFHLGQLAGSRPCVERVRSWRGVWSYASKYLGKTFEVAGWGDAWTGRFWGVVRRENVPFGVEVVLDVSYSDAVRAMRYQRRFARLKSRRAYENSITTFCDADRWVFALRSEASLTDD